MDQVDQDIKQVEDQVDAEEIKKDPSLPVEKTDVPSSPSFNDGVLIGATLDEQWRIATAFSQGGLLPKGIDTPQKAFTAIQFAVSLGLPPATALRQIAIVNGVPSLWGDLPLALVNKRPDFEYKKELVFDKDYNEICFTNKNLDAEPYGAVCKLKRRGKPEVEGSFTIRESQKAGLSQKDNWKKYPKRMLIYRARATAIKDSFPDAINGAGIAEYDHNVLPKDGPSYNGDPMQVDGEVIDWGEKNELAEKLQSLIVSKKMNTAQTIGFYSAHLKDSSGYSVSDPTAATKETLELAISELSHGKKKQVKKKTTKKKAVKK